MGSPAADPGTGADPRSRLAELTLADERRLRRKLEGTRRTRPQAAADAAIAAISAEIDTAAARVAARRATVPTPTYPAELPVSQRREDLLAAIGGHQVVIVAGETGSGKTTQLPKICLELGRGVRAMIGHTQPRRLAARTVAERVASELGVPLGGAVGYQVRFNAQVGPDTLIKVMTDGILLAEIAADKMLYRYDTLIIDEAHERSLNVDFILGYLKGLLPLRPDLKLVITSATIDPGRFAEHFADPATGTAAPVIEVSGRTYPVALRYRPVVDPDDPAADPDRDQVTAICDAVVELAAEPPGDVLVFLSGEREIRDAAEALGKVVRPGTEIVPLFARLSSAEQYRVFAPHPGRRIVLATNVAETSLTVPGIRYVVDPGTARISRYSHRLKVQRLPIEAISQASANQRKGRCGRLSDGICIRLYTQADFESRPAFTDPEILRTNLASVILAMTAANLGDIAAFPFLDPPDRRAIRDGLDLLHELGALDPAGALTPLGRRLAVLPVDPRLGRMILAADGLGCLREVLVITAALSIVDPRERPTEQAQAATAMHARFTDKESDFLSLVNLWNHLREQQKERSGSAFRRMCKTEFLHYLRVREWQDLYAQLRQVARTLDLVVSDGPVPPAQSVHTALAAGLLSHIGARDPQKQDYLGARGARFALFPGSALFRKPPRFVIAAELVETSRLWGRVAARIEPEWIEPLAEHLVKRSYSEPHWAAKAGAVLATEKVTLYGVPIVAARQVNYGRIDPALSRELFIRHALVEGDWRTHHTFFHANRELLDEVEELEHRARRRDIVVDDEALFDFYDQRIPATVVSGRHFDSWWKKHRHREPDLLSFEASMLVTEAAQAVRAADYPDTWPQGDLKLALTYQFEPGTDADGVTVHIPLSQVGSVDPVGFDWQIPGLRLELVTALIRSLPKALRRAFVPVPDTAREVLARLDGADPGAEPVTVAIARALRTLTGEVVPPDAWDWSRVPEHLRVTFRVLGDGDVVAGTGAVAGEGKDLAALKAVHAVAARELLTSAAPEVRRRGLTAFPAELPRTVARRHGTVTVTGFPALVPDGDAVAVDLFESPAAANAAMWTGTRALLRRTVPSPVKYVTGRLSNPAKLALMRGAQGSLPAQIEDCVTAAMDALIAAAGGPAWDAAGFAAIEARVRAGLPDTTLSVLTVVQQVLTQAHEVRTRLASTANPALLASLADLRGQLDALVYPGFVAATGLAHLGDLPRYLTAMARRLDRLADNPARDRQLMSTVDGVWREYEQLRREVPPSPELAEIRWMIEELRVGLFAQALGTAYPVSDKRIFKAMDLVPG